MKQYSMLEWTPERVSKFWDYQSRFPHQYFTYLYGDVILDRLDRLLRGRGSVLDYGCGTGFMIEHMLRRGYTVTGLDFSPESVRGVDAKFKGKAGFRGAQHVDDLMRTGARFDAILVFEVIEHLSDEYLDLTARNLKQLLNPGGIVVVTTPNGERLEDLHVFCPGCESVFHRWQHIRSWTEESLPAAMRAKGFRVDEVFTTDFTMSFRKGARQELKRRVKRMLGRGDRDPHLVCVCSL